MSSSSRRNSEFIHVLRAMNVSSPSNRGKCRMRTSQPCHSHRSSRTAATAQAASAAAAKNRQRLKKAPARPASAASLNWNAPCSLQDEAGHEPRQSREVLYGALHVQLGPGDCPPRPGLPATTRSRIVHARPPDPECDREQFTPSNDRRAAVITVAIRPLQSQRIH